jgi:hypothetical protein
MIPKNADPTLVDEERAELEAVVEVLGNSSRLVNLLRYIGERYFADESSQLSEYNIATEVFGRSKTTFDSGEDAIARVEAHRLRKRLKDFYEGAGKNHPLQLSIPPGSYIPTFTRLEVAVPASPVSAAVGEDDAVLSDRKAEQRRRSGHDQSAPLASRLKLLLRRIPRYEIYGLLAAVLILSAWGTHRFLATRTAATTTAASNAVRAGLLASTATTASVPLRLLAGYSGKPQTDSNGSVWQEDRYAHGGGGWHRSEGFIARTSDPLLFRQWRTGDFEYQIPLQPGVYELHLYFVASDRTNENLSTFNVKINGDLVLGGFDVNADALGNNIADERVFRDISPGQDGILHIAFGSETGTPQLNALEILPGKPHQQLPIRIVTQQTSYTDRSGQLWRPDTYYMNGRLSAQPQQVTGSPDSDLFAGERFGHFTYAIPVDPRDRYTLVLHFAEFYFGTQGTGGGVGNRVFRVMANGVVLLDNFDIFKEAGSLHSLTKTFNHLKPTAQGKLNITFEPITNNATVSGIEVLDETH